MKIGLSLSLRECKMNLSEPEEPLIPANTSLPELTLKVIIFSVLLAAILAASNAYLGLKIGSTVSASIPASVLALGILRFFRRSNVLESNIIQTSASAGEGVAAAAAFVLPAMLILHIWQGFPYWKTVGIISIGSIFGVLFSVPLRRVLLQMPGLRFPEGTAIGNVLKASTKKGISLKLLTQGGIVGALVSLAEGGFKIISEGIELWFAAGPTVLGVGLGFSPAVLAAGFIIGIQIGVTLLVGLVFGWLIVLPILGYYYGVPHDGTPMLDVAMRLWSTKLRYVGVGTMLVGGVWTLIGLIKPIFRGIKLSFQKLKLGEGEERKIPRTERDVPFYWVAIGSGIMSIFLYLLIFDFMLELNFGYSTSYLLFLSLLVVLFILIIGFLIATIIGYFAGLIGTTNNPLSGMLIVALLLFGIITFLLPGNGSAHANKVASLLIIVITFIAAIGAIANENMQDLKAGQMVGATPWKQQFVLVIGSLVSALVIAPILEVLYQAYGMGGVFPRPDMNPAQMLAAPQANLLAALAQGISGHQGLPWNMVLIGGIFAVLVIIVDEYLKTKNQRLPALGVGLGIYLPTPVILPIVVGSFVNYLVKRKLKGAQNEESGILLACGLVAGSALMGVLLAIPFVVFGSTDVLRIVPKGFAPIADLLGLVVIGKLCYWMYHVSKK